MLNFGLWSSIKGMVKVPDLDTLSKTDAIAALQAKYLKPIDDGEVATSDANLDDKIESQDPAKDSLVAYESEVKYKFYNFSFTPYSFTPYSFTPTYSFTPAPACGTSYGYPVSPTCTPGMIASRNGVCFTNIFGCVEAVQIWNSDCTTYTDYLGCQ
jgi:hypothetical protein